jgi:hypothetical protein
VQNGIAYSGFNERWGKKPGREADAGVFTLYAQAQPFASNMLTLRKNKNYSDRMKANNKQLLRSAALVAAVFSILGIGMVGATNVWNPPQGGNPAGEVTVLSNTPVLHVSYQVINDQDSDNVGGS